MHCMNKYYYNFNNKNYNNKANINLRRVVPYENALRQQLHAYRLNKLTTVETEKNKSNSC